MTPFVESALRAITLSLQDECGLKGGDGLLVAVSGGPDSMALLTLLHHLQGSFPLSLHALYVDHALQGEVSAQAGRHVKGYCEGLNIPCTIETLPEGWAEAPGQGGIQARARELRYRALEGAMVALGLDAVVTGHTRSDQAETVLVRALRGTGLRGLCGMSPRRGHILRPMLALGRGDILRVVADLDIPALEDPTNSSQRYERNRVRSQLLPLIKEVVNPQAEAALSRLARSAQQDDDFIGSQVEALWQGCGGALTQPLLQACHPAIAHRLLRRFLEGEVSPRDGRQIGAMVARALESLGSKEGVQLTRGAWLWVGEAGSLALGPPPEMRLTPIKSQLIQIPGLTLVPEVGILLEVSAPMVPPDPSELGVSAERILLDLDALVGPLRLRGVKPGDRFRPFKGAGSKKVKDYFTDIKLDIHRRRQVVLILDGDTIVWVVGLRQGSHAPLTEGTRRAIAITCRPS